MVIGIVLGYKYNRVMPRILASPPARQEQRRMNRRLSILEAAERLFAEHGYDQTKVTDICSRAGIAYGTFFNHYSEKQDLIRALAERSLQNLAEGLERLAKQPGSIEDQLLFLFEGGEQGFDPSRRELVGLIWKVAATDAPEERGRRFHSAFEAFLAEGVLRGLVRDDVPVETLAEVVGSVFSSMAIHWVHSVDYPHRERSAMTARFLADALAPRPGVPQTTPNN
jgi:AcrR family transcriptional regulator